MTPHPSANVDQAVHVLEILGQWTARGWNYRADCYPNVITIRYSNPDYDGIDWLEARGVNHFDALCQATTVMQVLLEEHPEEA